MSNGLGAFNGGDGVKHRVAVVHPWMPQYRVEFFARLRRVLLEDGVQLNVFYGDVPREWSARNDARNPSDATMLPTRFYRIGRRTLSWKRISAIDSASQDLLILEQAVRNLETYWLLLRHRSKVAFWGHGRTYTEKRGGREEAVKAWVTRLGKWFFAYTNGGREAVVSSGYSRERTTVVRNAIDTDELRDDLANAELKPDHQLKEFIGGSDSVMLYLGGIDSSKRIEYLLDAAEIVNSKVPNLRFLIAGDGAEADLTRKYATDRAWVKYVGSAFGLAKARLLNEATILVIPGRVGLIAVDSIVSGVPIVTTKWPYHAPEYEYVATNGCSLASGDSVEEYADAIVSILGADRLPLTTMQNACHEQTQSMSLDLMVQNFASGVLAALSSVR